MFHLLKLNHWELICSKWTQQKIMKKKKDLAGLWPTEHRSFRDRWLRTNAQEGFTKLGGKKVYFLYFNLFKKCLRNYSLTHRPDGFQRQVVHESKQNQKQLAMTSDLLHLHIHNHIMSWIHLINNINFNSCVVELWEKEEEERNMSEFDSSQGSALL